MALNFKISAPAKSIGAAPAAQSRTLLIVDDTPAMLVTLRGYFSRLGWHLLEADSIAEAIKLWDANSSHIDAVVTDYVFEGKQNGLDLVTYIQSRQRGVPCVVISGQWAPDRIPRDEPTRNLFYRAKPFDFRDLFAQLNELCAAQEKAGTGPQK